eukprot:3082616-Rhodomonas_salina.1
MSQRQPITYGRSKRKSPRALFRTWIPCPSTAFGTSLLRWLMPPLMLRKQMELSTVSVRFVLAAQGLGFEFVRKQMAAKRSGKTWNTPPDHDHAHPEEGADSEVRGRMRARYRCVDARYQCVDACLYP